MLPTYIHTYIHIYWYIYIGKIKGAYKKEENLFINEKTEHVSNYKNLNIYIYIYICFFQMEKGKLKCLRKEKYLLIMRFTCLYIRICFYHYLLIYCIFYLFVYKKISSITIYIIQDKYFFPFSHCVIIV